MRRKLDSASDGSARRKRPAWLPCLAATALFCAGSLAPAIPDRAKPATGSRSDDVHWIGTWAAAPQRAFPGRVETYRNRTLRLIVHTTAAGRKIRIRISNTFGDRPMLVGGAHVARRSAGADVDPASDRTVTFGGHGSTTIPARSSVVSDAVDLDVPALSDLAVSLFLPEETAATTSHALARQTSYVADGDVAGKPTLPGAKTIRTWPFLTGVDVAASTRGAAIVAFGSSLTDGDGSTKDANTRWPDLLAKRLLESDPKREIGVLNEGIIGNRLLADIDSPRQSGGPFGDVLEKLGPGLGEAGVTRFDRDVLGQAGVRWVVLGLGINDLLFPGSFTAATERVTADEVIAGTRELVARAHKAGIHAIGTTLPPFENATFTDPTILFFTPEKEAERRKFNEWVLHGGGLDGVIDFDAAVRDPARPTRILPAYDSGDHLHPNDAGYVASAGVIPLSLFRDR
jgi:lysophospholipase L1-like esterase